mgnify:CR=1 FL=1
MLGNVKVTKRHCLRQSGRPPKRIKLVSIAMLMALSLHILGAPVVKETKVWAAEPGKASRLASAVPSDLPGLLSAAFKNSPMLKTAALDLEEALQGKKQLDAALKPQLSIAAQHKLENAANNAAVMGAYREVVSAAVRDAFEHEPPVPPPPTDNINTTMGSVTWYQKLGPDNQLKALINRGNTAYAMAEIGLKEARASLVVAVQPGYYGVLRAYNGLSLAVKAEEHQKLNLDAEIAQQELGTRTPLDVLKEKNAYLEAQKTTETAKIGVEMAVMSLLQTIGQDTRGSITRDDALDWAKVLADGYHVKVEPWQIDFDQAYDHMLLHRPEINQLKHQETLAQIALDEVRNDRDWNIKLSGQYVLDETVLQSSIDSDKTWISTAARSKMSDMPDFLGADPAGGVGSGTGNTDASSGLEIDDPWQVELSASYSFGDGGRKKADLLAKEAALEKASLRRAVAEDGFYLELNGAVKELKQLWQAYLLAQEGKRAADETLKQLELMHELGSLTSKEVREGQLMVAQAENLVLDAGLNYNGQKTKIWAMVGIDSEIMLHAVAGENWDILKQGADS